MDQKRRDELDANIEARWEKTRIKYPLKNLEREFEKIEKLGYKVIPTEESCYIYLNDNMIIDADFADDYHTNAAHAIEAFWNMNY